MVQWVGLFLLKERSLLLREVSFFKNHFISGEDQIQEAIPIGKGLGRVK